MYFKIPSKPNPIPTTYRHSYPPYTCFTTHPIHPIALLSTIIETIQSPSISSPNPAYST